jgi:P-type E1-E2 ATPase
MLSDGNLVRKLQGIESLACMNSICFDKTGTITKNNLQPISFVTLQGVT